MRTLLIAVALLLAGTGAAQALEPLGGTYYITASDGRWKLTFFRNGTYEVESPRGRSTTGSYNSTDSELALIENGGAGNRRHFRYYRVAGQLSLESTRHDASTNDGILNRMPPGIGGSAIYYDRAVVVQPAPVVVQPPVVIVQPSRPVYVPPPTWQTAVSARINDLLDAATRETTNARAYLRSGDRSAYIDSVRRARVALDQAEALAGAR